MGSSDNVGSAKTFREFIRHAYISAREFEVFFERFMLGDISIAGLSDLVEALALGNKSWCDEVLRRWGVR